MKTNEDLRKDIQDAIKGEPRLHTAEIGVIVNKGIVTLTGTVDNYTKKIEVENAVKKVIGVKAVAEDIKVMLPNRSVRTDTDIAADVVTAFDKNRSLPYNIKIKVENGLVYLEGKISWDFQREAARKSLDSIRGVKGVIDNLELKSDIHHKMEEE